MAFKLNIILLLSALGFLFLSKATPQPAMAPSPSKNNGGAEVIKNVETNREVQDLGRFVVDEANSRNSSSPPLSFIQVVVAIRWPVKDAVRYFLNINATRTSDNIQVNGSLYAYVLVYTDKKLLQTWIFKAINE